MFVRTDAAVQCSEVLGQLRNKKTRPDTEALHMQIHLNCRYLK